MNSFALHIVSATVITLAFGGWLYSLFEGWYAMSKFRNEPALETIDFYHIILFVYSTCVIALAIFGEFR